MSFAFLVQSENCISHSGTIEVYAAPGDETAQSGNQGGGSERAVLAQVQKCLGHRLVPSSGGWRDGDPCERRRWEMLTA